MDTQHVVALRNFIQNIIYYSRRLTLTLLAASYLFKLVSQISLVNYKKKQEDKAANAAMFSKPARHRTTVAVVARGGNVKESSDTLGIVKFPVWLEITHRALSDSTYYRSITFYTIVYLWD